MTYGDAKLFEVIAGYKCIKAGSQWATFTPDITATQLSEAELAERRARRAAEENALKEHYRAGLSIDERNIAYRQILTQLSLHAEDRADLERRGLSTNTIAAFKSITPWHRLRNPVHPNTPAVGENGTKLLSPYTGYLVPAKDIQGRILGFQIRNRDTSSDDVPRYPWLSTPGRPTNLRNGELPLTFADGDRTVINVAEGILKPIIAAERTGQAFIGAAGGNFASSSAQLKAMCQALGVQMLVLNPDGGAVSNPLVMRQYNALAEIVEGLGYQFLVRWWGQTTKADGDVDDITPEQFEQSALISWTAFTAKTPLSSESFARKEAKRQQSQAEWKRQQRVERDRHAYARIAQLLGIEADINTDAPDYKNRAREQFYRSLKQLLKYETHTELISGFAEEIQPPADGRSLVAYDCSQGTGKSNRALIPPALQVAKSGGRVLIFVPTRGLAKEFKHRINQRAGRDIAATHLDASYYSAAIVVSCPESAYKFKGQRFDLIQIDEANEVLHRIESAELGNAGPQSLAAFRQLLASVPRVAIATATMSGWTLAATQTIGGFTPTDTHLQRRSRPATEMTIFEYGNYYQWLQKIIEALERGQRVAIPSGSRGKGRAIDRVLRAKFPDKTGLAIDGAATLQNQRSKFLSDPDTFLSEERPDWFIFTPVINSGVSIEGQHFDIQFEYATPHEGAQSISQRGERIRSAIGRDGAIKERHIYFSQRGAPTLEAYPDALSWQYWADELANEAKAPMGAAAALAKALGAEKALKPMQREAEKFTAMRPNLPHFLALKAFEIIFKRKLLHENWQCYGWRISPVPLPDQQQQKQLDALKVLSDNIRIGLIEQRGRTLKKTQTRASETVIDEINNPFQAARATKLHMEQRLGKQFLSQQDSQFFTAWAADKTASNPGIRSVVRSQLLDIALHDPACFDQIERMKAIQFLAGRPELDSTEFWHFPELPAPATDIELVSLISRCPGVAKVIKGELVQWTNQHPQVIAAGLYLIAHAKQIAANTKRVGLTRGAKFSNQMAPAALFNKALELVGHKPIKDTREGSGARLNLYRLEVIGDVLARRESLKAKQPTPLQQFQAELKIIRAQTRTAVNTAAKHQIIKKALAWVDRDTETAVSKALSAIRRRHAYWNNDYLSNLGDVNKMDACSRIKISHTPSPKTTSPPPIYRSLLALYRL
ncbi:hypothetical protein S7335_1149 [Synechococcus sp. PCC 7335]|nr:hypothetical protein S7335_1149 [Synechococcus sp. PCC 7335]